MRIVKPVPTACKTLLTMLILGMAAVAGCERRAGGLIEQGRVERYGISLLMQLYAIAHYGPERQIVVWCTSPNSGDQASKKRAAQQHLKIEGDNWLLMFIAHAFPPAGSGAPVATTPPIDRAQVLSASVAFADVGPASFAITFDGCRTAAALGAVAWYHQLFTHGEVRRDFTYPRPPAFVAHRLSADGSGICFRVNPAYVMSTARYDVCTRDRGSVWYARLGTEELEPPGADDRTISDTTQPPVDMPPVKASQLPTSDIPQAPDK